MTVESLADEIASRRDRLRWVTVELQEAERDAERWRREQAAIIAAITRLLEDAA